MADLLSLSVEDIPDTESTTVSPPKTCILVTEKDKEGKPVDRSTIADKDDYYNGHAHELLTRLSVKTETKEKNTHDDKEEPNNKSDVTDDKKDNTNNEKEVEIPLSSFTKNSSDSFLAMLDKLSAFRMKRFNRNNKPVFKASLKKDKGLSSMRGCKEYDVAARKRDTEYKENWEKWCKEVTFLSASRFIDHKKLGQMTKVSNNGLESKLRRENHSENMNLKPLLREASPANGMRFSKRHQYNRSATQPNGDAGHRDEEKVRNEVLLIDIGEEVVDVFNSNIDCIDPERDTQLCCEDSKDNGSLHTEQLFKGLQGIADSEKHHDDSVDTASLQTFPSSTKIDRAIAPPKPKQGRERPEDYRNRLISTIADLIFKGKLQQCWTLITRLTKEFNLQEFYGSEPDPEHFERKSESLASKLRLNETADKLILALRTMHRAEVTLGNQDFNRRERMSDVCQMLLRWLQPAKSVDPEKVMNTLSQRSVDNISHLDCSGLDLSEGMKAAYLINCITDFLKREPELLVCFTINSTGITDEKFSHLRPHLARLPTLQIIHARGNKLTQDVIAEYFISLKHPVNFPRLRWIDLRNNVDIFHLPENFVSALMERWSDQCGPSKREMADGRALHDIEEAQRMHEIRKFSDKLFRSTTE